MWAVGSFWLGRLFGGVMVRQSLLERYGESKYGSRSWFAFRTDVPSHQFHQLFADGKSQSRSAIFSGGGPVSLYEGLE